MSLDKAMDKVFATASSWKFAMQDLAEKLQQMLGLTLTVSEFNRSNQRPELAQPVNVLQSLHLCLF
jgi:hypothetical protein